MRLHAAVNKKAAKKKTRSTYFNFLSIFYLERADTEVKRHAVGHDGDDYWTFVVLLPSQSFKLSVCWKFFSGSVKRKFIFECFFQGFWFLRSNRVELG